MTSAPGTAENLLNLARTGDPEAFGALVRPHLAMFFRSIDRILGNEAESQDALQDALVALHRAVVLDPKNPAISKRIAQLQGKASAAPAPTRGRTRKG